MTSCDNNSNGIHARRQCTDADLMKMLKLEEFKTEIFTTLDEYGKLKIFESAEEIVTYFTNFRILFYDERKKRMISGLEKQILFLDNRARFLKHIIEERLEIRNVPKLTIVSKLQDFKFDKIDDSYDYLLRMPIYSLTRELYEKILQELQDVKLQLEEVKLIQSKDMYLKDLQDLKKKLK